MKCKGYHHCDNERYESTNRQCAMCQLEELNAKIKKGIIIHEVKYIKQPRFKNAITR